MNSPSTIDTAHPRPTMHSHQCSRALVCSCSPLFGERNPQCRVHGRGEWPRRCDECGRFMRDVITTSGNPLPLWRKVLAHGKTTIVDWMTRRYHKTAALFTEAHKTH
jgi:hypothetical protein